ncbi:nucleoside triphosphate pyrophosphohydrolase family protein [Candidatus Saccharibacteria bacterium]|nr:nucleoside triphosphate pyrophosphohydrolase family protein [Candidatus Saccharibacteria bacterium]
MDFNEYQKKAIGTDLEGKKDGNNIFYLGFMTKALGLVGEAGEVTEDIKKILRDKNGELTEDDRTALTMELGDVMWYIAVIADYLGVSMEEVAEKNLEKLQSRKQRGKLHGAGNNR